MNLNFLASRLPVDFVLRFCRIALACLGLLAACTPHPVSPAQVAHVRLDGAGRALVDVDKLYVCYERAAHTQGGLCNGQPLSLADWNAHLQSWDQLRAAIQFGYKTMLAAEVAAQRWERGDKRAWNGSEACVAGALIRVRDALQSLPDVAVQVPPALAAVTPSACNCHACEDEFYPYATPPAQSDHCESALSCQ
jgi:hypothetical protein